MSAPRLAQAPSRAAPRALAFVSLWTAFGPSIASAQTRHHHRHHHRSRADAPPEPAGAEPAAAATEVATTTVPEATAPPAAPPAVPPAEPTAAEVIDAPAADETALNGMLHWAEQQPIAEWAIRPTTIRRWHPYVSVGVGFALSFRADALGLLGARVVNRYPGFRGPVGGLEIGAARGAWSLGLSASLLFVPGGDAAAPAARDSFFTSVEACVAYIHPLNRTIGLGGRVGAGATLALAEAVIDTQGVAHRLRPQAFFSAEAAVVLSERIGDRLRLEQHVGARVIQGDLIGGMLAIAVGQLVLRYVL